jgi:excisionase family DNA binding protein
MATDTTSPIPSLLSVADVAEILGVKRSTVYSLVRDGKLTPVDLPVRKTKFRKADIAAFIGEDGDEMSQVSHMSRKNEGGS